MSKLPKRKPVRRRSRSQWPDPRDSKPELENWSKSFQELATRAALKATDRDGLASDLVAISRAMSESVDVAFLTAKYAIVRGENVQSEEARKARAKQAEQPKNELQNAIKKASNGAQLNSSRKFAESIEPEVRSILGVDSKARGYGWNTICREIRAMHREARGKLEE